MALESELRRRRGRRLKWSVLTALATRPLALVTPFIIVPLLWASLGPAHYGLFELASTLSAWLSLGNFGVGLVLMNGLTAAYVDEDRGAAVRLVTTLLVVAGATSAVLLVLGVGAFVLMDLRSLFRVSALIDRWTFVLLGATTVFASLLGVLSGLAASIYAAYQENHRNNLWDGLAKVVALAAVYFAVRLRGGVVLAVAAFVGSAALLRTANLVWLLLREKPWLRPRLSHFSIALARTSFGEGAGFAALQLASMGIVQSDRFVIGALGGAEEVARYSVWARLFTVAYGVFMLVLTPLWPAHGEALRRGDWAWVDRAVRNSVLIGVGLMVALGVLLSFKDGWLVAKWLGPHGPRVAPTLVLALTLTFVSRVWVDARAVVLNSAGVLRNQAVVLAANAVLFYVLARLAYPRFGLLGAVWSMPIASLVTSAWSYPLLMHQLRNGRTVDAS